MKIEIENQAQTERLAQQIAALTRQGNAMALHGDLAHRQSEIYHLDMFRGNCPTVTIKFPPQGTGSSHLKETSIV